MLWWYEPDCFIDVRADGQCWKSEVIACGPNPKPAGHLEEGGSIDFVWEVELVEANALN